MKKSIFILFLFVSFFSVFAQEQQKLIFGKVVLETFAVPNVHIVNKTSKTGTISDENGLFEIIIKENDVLFFSHLTLEQAHQA